MSETADHEERLIAAVSDVVFMSSPRGTPGPRSIIALLRQRGVIPPAGAVVLSAEEANVARNACLTSATVMDTMNEADAAAMYRALAAKLIGGAS